MSILPPHACHPKQPTAQSRASGTCSDNDDRMGMFPSLSELPYCMPLTAPAPEWFRRFRTIRGTLYRRLPRLAPWLGDLIGAASLFATLYLSLFVPEIFR